ncbi:DUF6603 domain-containing protein [Streptomyces sp. NPDC048595]|uniref:DUF6603 domain-containing protein n=1 Tax=Streptomyces sp. NPDC048595 TaxID=3365576 RepID=UPI00371575E4
MTLSVAALREKLANSAGGEFHLTAEELGIPAVAALFDDHLGADSLTVADADPQVDQLAVGGELKLRHLDAAVPAFVSFLADETGEDVTGVHLDTTLPDWNIPAGHLDIDPGVLRGSGFDVLHLLLDATPDPEGTVAPRTGIGAERPLSGASGGPKAYVAGLQPQSEDSAWQLAGFFAPVPLGALGDLATLAPGLAGTAFDLPEAIGTVGALHVSALSVSFAPAGGGSEGELLSFWIRVRLGVDWTVIPNTFTISGLRAEFDIRPSPEGFKVGALFGGVLTIGDGIQVAAAFRVPGLQVFAQLTRPIPLAPLLAKYFPGLDLPADALTVAELRLYAQAGSGPPGYSLALTLDGDWPLPVHGITLRELELTIDIGGGTRNASVTAGWAVGEGTVRVAAAYQNGGWQFTGAAFGITTADLFRPFGAEPPSLAADLALRELGIAFDGRGESIELSGALGFPLGDADAALTLTATLTRGDSGYDKNVTGHLAVVVPVSSAVDPEAATADEVRLLDDGYRAGYRVLAFEVNYQEDGSGSVVTGKWEGKPGVSLTDLVDAMGLDLPELPDALKPVLESLAVQYHSATGELLLTATTEHTGWVYAGLPGGPNGKRLSAVAVRGRLDARASSLPLIGEAIPKEHDVVLDGVAFTGTPQGWTAAKAQQVNAALDVLDPVVPRRLPRFGTANAGPGYAVRIELSLGGVPQSPLLLPITGKPGGSGVAAAPPGRTPVVVPSGVRGAADDTASRELELTFGPVRLRRLVLGFADGAVFVAFDALFTAGPVEFALLGLGIGIDTELRPVPVLRGAALFIDKPPLKVAGVLERQKTAEYDELVTGMLAVETGFFAMQAMGSYARSRAGWASVFLFGEIGAQGGAALFGPPAFTVNALSGGFGVNSTVRTPDITEIPRFPLVNRLTGGGPGDPTPERILEELMGPGAWVQPHPDRYWGAIGLEFTTFKFLHTRALALVEFGDAFKVMILGRTSITFPKNASADRKVHARLNIDIKLAYEAVKNLLSLDIAVAEGSYVFDPAIRLTGGIAVYVWTGGQHGGDFVISAGGYHPNYRIPAHYPRPAPLGFVWSPDDKLRVSAQGYTALTPNAFMLGGRLDARYDRGLLSAWFTAHLDALIQWNPFRLEIELGIRIGVAFTIKVWFVKVRVSIEVGIDLALWTPPLGGRVSVKVWFISFSFSFGSGRTSPPAISWGEFRQQLPEPLAIAPLRGVLADVAPSELAARSAAGKPTLVSAFGFALSTEAALPASRITVNGEDLPADIRQVDIRPMKKQNVTSEHKVTVCQGGTVLDWKRYGWKITPVAKSVSQALYGVPRDEPTLADADLLPDRPGGVRIEVPPPDEGDAVGPITARALDVERLDDGPIPLRRDAADGPAPREDTDSIRTITETLATAATTARRSALHTALTGLGVAPAGDCDGPLRHWAEQAGHALTDPPLTTAAR